MDRFIAILISVLAGFVLFNLLDTRPALPVRVVCDKNGGELTSVYAEYPPAYRLKCDSTTIEVLVIDYTVIE